MTSATFVSASVSLQGRWAFQLAGDAERAADCPPPHDLTHEIHVPGAWGEQGFSAPQPAPLWGWQSVHTYEGVAWYGRSIRIPDDWAEQRVTLTLSGVRWRSRVWVDGVCAGEADSLSTAHRYDLTALVQAGHEHWLAVQVDNRMLYPLEESHIHSIQTAGRWGGITGDAVLSAQPMTGIDRVRVWPDIHAHRFDVELGLRGAADGLTVDVTVADPSSGARYDASTAASGQTRLAVSLRDGARLWSDDDPYLYDAVFILRDGDTVIDRVDKRLGLRAIRTKGRQILLNDRPVFLRGYVDCCIFPQTGYPSWDVDEYRRQFRIARAHGFNHVRLHSWTAPEPFWQAADELGMLVQAELPHWSAHYRKREQAPDCETHAFLTRELDAIVDALHAHPAWVLFSNGNELMEGSDAHPRLLELSARGKALDPTRLFTDNTGFGELPAPNRPVDFYIQSCNWHPPKKIYDAASADTTEDFSAVTAAADRPIIGHEHGQFTMYVRPQEATKYHGALQPAWLDSFAESLQSKGLTDRVETFIAASGRHIARTYKENIERARRTRGLAGLQLLDIRDFPGQGHATTGLLDMFWDSKGLLEAQDFARFNSAVVLLMRTASPTGWNAHPLSVDLEVSNFGAAELPAQVLHWQLRDRDTGLTHAGHIDVPPAPIGDITPLARLSIALEDDGQPHAWELRVQLGEHENHWHLWTFPAAQPNAFPRVSSRLNVLRGALADADFTDDYSGPGLTWDSGQPPLFPTYDLAISDQLSVRLLQYLHDGGSVWLMPPREQLFDSVRTRYLPPFWSYLLFPDNVSTVMGMTIPQHPALGRFPHDGMSDWQWYSLVNETPAICLDSVPFVQPVVEVIDNFTRMKRLCYAFEARVGSGRLFVSTWRLFDRNVIGRPEARFLFDEVLRYLLGSQFQPDAALSVSQLLGLFRLTNTHETTFE